jgi:hypothetical protein
VIYTVPLSEALVSHKEYSIICDFCGNESTRDGNAHLAEIAAEREGFRVIDNMGTTQCKECANPEPAMPIPF